ncbi:MAG: hypothetical protein ABIH67_04430 [Candidatus Uhrbacteria bacterium]
MTLTTHATVGMLIGYTVGQPLAGFVLGFISHLLLDVIPHGDYELGKSIRKSKAQLKKILGFITLDAIVAIFLILILVNIKELVPLRAISWAIVGAVLPDLLVGIYDVTKNKWLKPINTLHFYFHDLWHKKRKDLRLSHALALQILIIILIQTQL